MAHVCLILMIFGVNDSNLTFLMAGSILPTSSPPPRKRISSDHATVDSLPLDRRSPIRLIPTSVRPPHRLASISLIVSYASMLTDWHRLRGLVRVP